MLNSYSNYSCINDRPYDGVTMYYTLQSTLFGFLRRHKFSLNTLDLLAWLSKLSVFTTHAKILRVGLWEMALCLECTLNHEDQNYWICIKHEVWYYLQKQDDSYPEVQFIWESWRAVVGVWHLQLPWWRTTVSCKTCWRERLVHRSTENVESCPHSRSFLSDSLGNVLVNYIGLEFTVIILEALLYEKCCSVLHC